MSERKTRLDQYLEVFVFLLVIAAVLCSIIDFYEQDMAYEIERFKGVELRAKEVGRAIQAQDAPSIPDQWINPGDLI